MVRGSGGLFFNFAKGELDFEWGGTVPYEQLKRLERATQVAQLRKMVEKATLGTQHADLIDDAIQFLHNKKNLPKALDKIAGQTFKSAQEKAQKVQEKMQKETEQRLKQQVVELQQELAKPFHTPNKQDLLSKVAEMPDHSERVILKKQNIRRLIDTLDQPEETLRLLAALPADTTQNLPDNRLGDFFSFLNTFAERYALFKQTREKTEALLRDCLAK